MSMRCISTMKTTAAPFFLSFLFSLLAWAVHAEERLIPLDEFHATMPMMPGLKSKGLEVEVWVQRDVNAPEGATGVAVRCAPLHLLKPEEVAALAEACAAALKDEDFRKEIDGYNGKFEYEAKTVEGRKCVLVQRGAELVLIPEEIAKLKEALALAQAAAAEAWYKMLLTARTLPEKTAQAHPPKAANLFFTAKLGEVPAEGLDYEVSLRYWNFSSRWVTTFRAAHNLKFARGGGTGGEWVKLMMEQVALALEAVGRKEAFACESPPDAKQYKFTVKPNLMTQKADVAFEQNLATGWHLQAQGSFGVAQLAKIREVMAKGEALEKWFKEHEGWFLERE